MSVIFTDQTEELFSSCCGATDRSNGDRGPSFEDIGFCPECHEHCEFVPADDDEEFTPSLEAFLTTAPKQLGISFALLLAFVLFALFLMGLGGR